MGGGGWGGGGETGKVQLLIINTPKNDGELSPHTNCSWGIA